MKMKSKTLAIVAAGAAALLLLRKRAATTPEAVLDNATEPLIAPGRERV